MNSESYKLDIDHERKIISFQFYGNPNPDEVTAFHHDYLEMITPIQTSEYLLLLDSMEMSVPETERLHQMQVSFALYRKSGFKEICIIIQNDEIRKKILKLIRFSGIEETSDLAYITKDEVDDVIEKHLSKLK